MVSRSLERRSPPLLGSDSNCISDFQLDIPARDGSLLQMLRQALRNVGTDFSELVSLRGSFSNRAPRSLRKLISGCSDPEIQQWRWRGDALSIENRSAANEAQGAASDGTRWFV